ncbi:MAG TPA: DUF302 domain-containing protein [Terriglobia bacterium]|nr:DUF302 domain-containing protein [Terriglobia bacterium]
MKNFEYTVETEKQFDDAVKAIEQKTAEKGFRVLHTHDVAATLAEKGFAQEPLKIIEVCNARYASEVLKKDIRTALMLPCPITVYSRNGKTTISTMLPTTLAEFFPGSGIETIAAEVEKVVLAIINEAC